MLELKRNDQRFHPRSGSTISDDHQFLHAIRQIGSTPSEKAIRAAEQGREEHGERRLALTPRPIVYSRILQGRTRVWKREGTLHLNAGTTSQGGGTGATAVSASATNTERMIERAAPLLEAVANGLALA
ncbi:hypothetical protein K0M31_007591 [Melipona bicolor]|uniref:Uncharacterized protein n=1 Tax=Melipona bicolor TaxID=60889 RepID=A0AA40KVT0_9HYME|nr:hypothetical protein K0M31_007591 [Melipona bicolor]